MSRKATTSRVEALPSPGRTGGEERRQQILREAMNCFSQKGFSGTTTRAIADSVGITEAALYRYFPSKEALYSAIIDAKISEPDRVAALQDDARAGDDRAVFAKLARQTLEALEADPSFLRILLYTGLEGHALSEPFFANRIQRMREFLANYIERRQREGAFRALDPLLGARAFLGMIVDYVIVREVFGQTDAYPMSPSQVADTFVEIFLNGIRSDGGRSDG